MSPEEWLATQQQADSTQSTVATPKGLSPEEWLAQQQQPLSNEELAQQQLNEMGQLIEPQPPREIPWQEEVVGGVETGMTLVTGATTGALGQLAGTLQQLSREIISGNYGTMESAKRVQAEAEEMGKRHTYIPRTEAGRRNLETIGEVVEPLVALTPASQQLAAATQPAIAVAKAELPVLRQAAQATLQKVRKPKPTSKQSMGAAEVPISDVRKETAKELGFGGEAALTKGQETRSPEALKFEVETAKQPETGAPIRERYAAQREQAFSKIDEFIDETGAELGEGRLHELGQLVDETLLARKAKDDAKVRALYKEADKAGEMSEAIDTSPLVNYLNESVAAESTSPVLRAARQELVRLGGAVMDEAGKLVPVAKLTVKDSEQLRKFINKNMQAQGPDQAYGPPMKTLIDDAQEGMGGDLYKKARKARMKVAQDYENSYLIKRLLGTKAGTEDRAIALEDVFKNVVTNPSTSVDQMRHVRKLLQTKTGGKQGPGAQVWREIQAQTIRHLKEQLDPSGRGEALQSRNFQKAIANLDKSGKLDYLFGKKGAEQLRTLDEIVQYISTVPPDAAINYSNTAATLAALMDMAISSQSGGLPLPVMSGARVLVNKIKDTKLKAKIKEHLGDIQK